MMPELKLKGVVTHTQSVLFRNTISIRDTRTKEGTFPAIRLNFINKNDFQFQKGDVVEILIRKTSKKEVE